MESGNRFKQYQAALAVNLGTLCIGSIFTWTSPTFPKLSGDDCPDQRPLDHCLNTSEQSLVGSLVNIGAMFGPILSGFLANRIGRKKVLLGSGIPFIVGWVVMATTTTVIQMYVARLLWGLGVGAVFASLPAYVGEISEKEVRGALGTFLQLFLAIGFMFSFGIGPYVSFHVLCYILVFLPVIFVVAFFFMPESPYFLLARDDTEAATTALMALRGKSRQGVQKELYEIKDSVDAAKGQTGTMMDLFKTKAARRAMFITMGLLAFQQLSCINAILYYTQDIFDAAGGHLPAEIYTIIVGVIQVVASAVSPFVVDRLGRRILLIFSGAGMGIGLGLLGLAFNLSDNGTKETNAQFLPVLSLIIYVITFCVGFGSLPWVVVSELFPSNIKNTASTFIASFCWLIAFIVTLFFPKLMASAGMDVTFWIFAVVCLLSAGFVAFALPETKGKSFKEIQDILEGSRKKKQANNVVI